MKSKHFQGQNCFVLRAEILDLHIETNCIQSSFVSKETTEVTVTRGKLWDEKV
jgi:hypothetical protein